MALVQNHHNVFKIDNVVRLSHPPRDAAPVNQIRTLIEHASGRVLGSLRQPWTRVVQWATQRRQRSRPTMAERARQRRELERLSDRELRDIGITRYEIEFVLRQSPGPER
jgi:uncharacterized protein DUF1127